MGNARFVPMLMVFMILEVEVVDNEEIGRCQNGGSRAADEDLAVQVVEVVEPPVDKDGGEEAEDADRAKSSVNILRYLVTLRRIRSDLVENSLVLSKDASESETGEKKKQGAPYHCPSIDILDIPRYSSLVRCLSGKCGCIQCNSKSEVEIQYDCITLLLIRNSSLYNRPIE